MKRDALWLLTHNNFGKTAALLSNLKSLMLSGIRGLRILNQLALSMAYSFLEFQILWLQNDWKVDFAKAIVAHAKFFYHVMDGLTNVLISGYP